MYNLYNLQFPIQQLLFWCLLTPPPVLTPSCISSSPAAGPSAEGEPQLEDVPIEALGLLLKSVSDQLAFLERVSQLVGKNMDELSQAMMKIFDTSISSILCKSSRLTNISALGASIVPALCRILRDPFRIKILAQISLSFSLYNIFFDYGRRLSFENEKVDAKHLPTRLRK